MSELVPALTRKDIPDHWEFDELEKEDLIIYCVNPKRGFLSVGLPHPESGLRKYAEYLFNFSGKPFAYSKKEGNDFFVKAGDLNTTYCYSPSDLSKFRPTSTDEIDIRIENPAGQDASMEAISAFVQYCDGFIENLQMGRHFVLHTDGSQIFTPILGFARRNDLYPTDERLLRLDDEHFSCFPIHKYHKLVYLVRNNIELLPIDSTGSIDNRHIIVEYEEKESELVLNQSLPSDNIKKTLTVPRLINMRAVNNCLFNIPTYQEMSAPNFVPEWVNIGKHINIQLSYASLTDDFNTEIHKA